MRCKYERENPQQQLDRNKENAAARVAQVIAENNYKLNQPVKSKIEKIISQLEEKDIEASKRSILKAALEKIREEGGFPDERLREVYQEILTDEIKEICGQAEENDFYHQLGNRIKKAAEEGLELDPLLRKNYTALCLTKAKEEVIDQLAKIHDPAIRAKAKYDLLSRKTSQLEELGIELDFEALKQNVEKELPE